MNISILSVFPELYESFLNTSLIKRAQDQGLITCSRNSFFSFVQPKERIDGPVFGHSSGMVIKPEVVQRAIAEREKQAGKAFKIFFSPHGKKIDQPLLGTLAAMMQNIDHLMLVAGRYEGMDARIEEEYADLILSVGDFVVMGGDIPAMLFLEGLLRLLPGVVGKKESIEHESFSGPFLDYPSYTTPVVWEKREVPAVLRSGNHAAIEQWQEQTAAQKTVLTHFDWLKSHAMNEDQKQLAHSCIPSHYIALLHDEIVLPHNIVGTTSVTSMDIHDIARSAKTYGLKNYSIVTPLIDQQKIVRTLLDFWQEGHGIDYNKQRHEAIKSVTLCSTLDEVIAFIEEQEGKKPLLISTSARSLKHQNLITYQDQDYVWQEQRPVLFIFGTGKGLAQQVIDRCDYLLLPLKGFTDFNHLSVRSAVAVILDRWLGIQPDMIMQRRLAK